MASRWYQSSTSVPSMSWTHRHRLASHASQVWRRSSAAWATLPRRVSPGLDRGLVAVPELLPLVAAPR